jgi:phosphatidylinositol alpha 1,6-mannosyltransferase
VVAPAAGGPVDLVVDGETGRLVPPHSAGALTDAVAELAGSAQLRQSMGAAGRLLVGGRSWAAIGDELIGHYEAVLGASRPAVTPAAA